MLDEAHHVFPVEGQRTPVEIPASLQSLVFVTVDPAHVNPAVLRRVELLLVVGKSPGETIRKFCSATGHAPPATDPADLPQGSVLAWQPGEEPTEFAALPTRATRRRHIRKYARGELSAGDSFYFRGPEGKLRLRAQNLQTFVQLAHGIDDDTWLFHLRENGYSRWIRSVLKDAELAEAVKRIENSPDSSATASRKAVAKEIDARYTAPG
jgi:hypothetical protein